MRVQLVCTHFHLVEADVVGRSREGPVMAGLCRSRQAFDPGIGHSQLPISCEVATVNVKDACPCDFIGPLHMVVKGYNLTRPLPAYSPQVSAYGIAEEDERLEVELGPEAVPFCPQRFCETYQRLFDRQRQQVGGVPHVLSHAIRFEIKRSKLIGEGNPKLCFGFCNRVGGRWRPVPPIGVVFFQHASRVPEWLMCERAECLLLSELAFAVGRQLLAEF